MPWCRGCRYDLVSLAAGQCPECGRPFDPLDADSVYLSPLRSRGWMVGMYALACGYGPLMWAWLHVVVVFSDRRDLGFAGEAFVGLMGWITIGSACFVYPLLVWLMIPLPLSLIRRGAGEKAAAAVFGAVAAIGSAIVLLWFDPTGVVSEFVPW